MKRQCGCGNTEKWRPHRATKLEVRRTKCTPHMGQLLRETCVKNDCAQAPCASSPASGELVPHTLGPTYNNNNTIWGGSVLTGKEPSHHFGELKHALPQAGGTTQSQLSHPISSLHHISIEHRLRRRQLNSDTNASNKKYLKENTR